MRSTLLLSTLVVAILSGCATYVTPGEKADLRGIAPAAVEAGFATRPTNPFPAAIAAVRVQGPTYKNYGLEQTGGTFGTGRYSVVTVREVEDDNQLEKVRALPNVSGVITVNRMLLPVRLETDADVRGAAARLHADLVLLYTFDTVFFDVDQSRPLTVITLGLSPTRKIRITTTVSALLLDTRTGYIYSAYEVTERRDVRATSWGSRESADEARKDAEQAGFGKLVDQFVSVWPKVTNQGAKKI